MPAEQHRPPTPADHLPPPAAPPPAPAARPPAPAARPLDGRVAVVTGAGQGLGASEARALAAAGARVVVNDLAGPALDSVVDEIRAAGGEAAACPGDVSDWATGEALVKTAVDTFGGLHVLVNNAGVLRDRMVFSMSEQEWDTVVRVHLRGHFVTSRFATAYWRGLSKSEGRPVYARIVNTSSEAYLLGSAGQPNYAAAKGGIVALTLATARGCLNHGVRANAICPRARTAMTGDLMGPVPDGPDPMAPERVTPLVVHLAGPAGERITGEVFVVHGDVVALLGPPTVRATFHATTGQWTAAELDAALGTVFIDSPPSPGYVCNETLPLAASTFHE
jgi:NAD(P)-dependent dehydrogenase (short-subunit alcohol dehydrogenase family)